MRCSFQSSGFRVRGSGFDLRRKLEGGRRNYKSTRPPDYQTPSARHSSIPHAQFPIPHSLHRGLTLLEVILALAILAGSVAVLGELVRTGMLNAADARDFTRAELHASSIMSQVVAGVIAPEAISSMPIEDDPNYSFSIASDQVEQGLLRISVTVARNQTSQKKPPEFTLTRWMVDPQMEMNLAAQAQANADAAAAEKAQAEEQQQQQQQNSSQGGTTTPTGM